MFKRTIQATARTTGRTVGYVRKKLLNEEELRTHYQNAADLARQHVDPRSVRAGRTETFANAMERLGLGPADIASAYRYQSFRFYLFFFLFVISMGMGGFALYRENVLHLLMCMAVSLVFAAQMFNASFRALQIQRHDLFPVAYWLQNPGLWIPGPYQPPQPKTKSSKHLARREDRTS